jgi:hypothetical protein
MRGSQLSVEKIIKTENENQHIENNPTNFLDRNHNKIKGRKL